ncbi:MAG: hypothetical protein J5802_05350 [Butyrivibrio sp.]|nr:hypothetical protein [Butyrivibrio sp.]
MNICKKAERTFAGDAYFLETLNDKVIVNSNYNGLIVLNDNIEPIKTIEIDQDICIYNAIVIDDERILLNCIDNKKLFVVNIQTSEVKSCYMPQNLVEEVLKEKVPSEDNRIVLRTYKGHDFVLDLNNMIIDRYDLSIEQVRKDSEEMPRDCIDFTKVGNNTVFLFEKELKIIGDEENVITPDQGDYFIKIKAVNIGLEKGLFVLESSFDSGMYKILFYTI